MVSSLYDSHSGPVESYPRMAELRQKRNFAARRCPLLVTRHGETASKPSHGGGKRRALPSLDDLRESRAQKEVLDEGVALRCTSLDGRMTMFHDYGRVSGRSHGVEKHIATHVSVVHVPAWQRGLNDGFVFGVVYSRVIAQELAISLEKERWTRARRRTCVVRDK